MTQISQLDPTTTLGSTDETILRQGTTDKRIPLELAGTLSWAKREGYTPLGGHLIGIVFSNTDSFTTYEGRTYFVNLGVPLPYTSNQVDPSADTNLYAKTTPEYKGLWPATGGSTNKGDTYQTQVSGVPTGRYFTALQNTTVDPVGDDVNWIEIVTGDIESQEVTSTGSTTPRKLSDRFADVVNVIDFGGVGNGADNTAAIQAADAVGSIFFPPGSYLTSYIPENKVFGEGAVITDTSDSNYTYTLDSTKQWIKKGSSGDFNLLITKVGVNAGKNLNQNSTYAIAVFGDHAMEDNETSVRSTAFGNFALQKGSDFYSLDAIGTSAMQSTYYGDRSVAVGHNASKWNGTNDAVAAKHDMYNGVDDPYGFNPRWATWRADYAGGVTSPSFTAATRDDFENYVSLGRNAALHGITIKNGVAVGYNAHAHALSGSGCVAVGSSALRDGIKATNTVAIGVSCAQELMDTIDDTIVGSSAMSNVTYSLSNTCLGSLTLNGESSMDDAKPFGNVAIGSSSMRNFKGNVSQSVAIGADSLRYADAESGNLGIQNVAIGPISMSANSITNNRNTAIGYRSAEYFDVAQYNTALGAYALRTLQNGNNHGGFTRCTGVGYDSRISGNNQVQLGGSSETTYAYGAVQDRSDERDKADIDPLSEAHIAFFMDIEWKMYRLDYRDDYIEVVEDEDGNTKTIFHEKDGSKKRKRLHCGAIAQQVETAMKKHGVDFAGLQYHAINGGTDVYTVGYQEFIAIQGEIIQRQQKRLDAIEGRLSKAGL